MLITPTPPRLRLPWAVAFVFAACLLGALGWPVWAPAAPKFEPMSIERSSDGQTLVLRSVVDLPAADAGALVDYYVVALVNDAASPTPRIVWRQHDGRWLPWAPSAAVQPLAQWRASPGRQTMAWTEPAASAALLEQATVFVGYGRWSAETLNEMLVAARYSAVWSAGNRLAPSTSAAVGPAVQITQPPAARSADAFVAVGFASAPGAVAHECALNDGAYAPCVSPHVAMPRYGQAQLLRPGEQRLRIRALPERGDPGPATEVRWTTLSVFDASAAAALPLARSTVQPTSAEADGWLGIFRINCAFSHAAYDDPVVFPNQSGMAHLHSFYGHMGLTAQTDAQSLYTSGRASCQGDTLNRSAYWVPSLLAPAANGANGASGWQVVQPLAGDDTVAHELFYYSVAVADRASLQPIPPGLRMIAGTASTQPGQAQPSSVARWHCLSWNASDGANPRFVPDIPECTVPDQVRLDIFFPSCWDGVRLDSADHKSHMAYPSDDGNRRTARCPASHPVPVPRVSYHYSYPVLPGNTDRVTRSSKGWRLSSDNFSVGNGVRGGWSLHGDWFNGWHPELMQTLIDSCLKRGLDCHDGSLANGWRLGGVATGTQAVPAIVNGGLGAHAGH